MKKSRCQSPLGKVDFAENSLHVFKKGTFLLKHINCLPYFNYFIKKHRDAGFLA